MAAPATIFLKTISSILEGFPPNLVRVLARKGRGRGVVRLTHREVSERSGLTERRVRTLSSMDSWEKVTILEADLFMRGCGVTLDTLWRHSAYLRRALDPTRTRRPLGYAEASGRSAPEPAVLVGAALGLRSRIRKS